jgi:CHASE2 domain-containing sensor protein
MLNPNPWAWVVTIFFVASFTGVVVLLRRFHRRDITLAVLSGLVALVVLGILVLMPSGGRSQERVQTPPVPAGGHSSISATCVADCG